MPLRDLGEHRFKDLAAPERVYQLGGLEFPALKSLYRVTLPVPATPFLGRAAELDAVVSLLADDGPWLVTLSGPGGTGKTRLALQAAAEVSDGFPDGVFWVGLAPLRDPELVVSQLAQAAGVDEQPGRPLPEVIGERLGGKRLLVLLDNAEHLLPGLAAELALLRIAVPTLRLLVTSRERLQLAGERVFAVQSLVEEEAVQLFCERSAGVGSTLGPSDAVRELWVRLDHLPLALELAAARTVLFTPEQLLERISQRLDLLTGLRDADPRQQTLRATIEWSYDLLDEAEQRLLRELSVFAGGCTYEAAEAVCGADPGTLQSLIDKSLLRRRDTDHGGPRFWMLETIREYGAEHLEGTGEAAEARRRHCGWVCADVARSGPGLALARNAAWYGAFAEELPNVRAAIASAEMFGDANASARLVTSLFVYAFIRGGLREARDSLERALALDPPPPARLEVLRSLTNACNRLADTARAVETAQEEVTLARSLADGPALVFALRDLGNAHMVPLDEPRAAEAFQESREVARKIGDLDGEAGAVTNLGALAMAAGRWSDALDLTREAIGLNAAIGDWEATATHLYNEALALWQLGSPDDARPLLVNALRLAVERDWQEGLLFPLELIGALDVALGDPERGAMLVGAGRRLREESGIGDYDPVHAGMVGAAQRTVAELFGPERCDELLHRGTELELTAAVALALGDRPSPASQAVRAT